MAKKTGAGGKAKKKVAPKKAKSERPAAGENTGVDKNAAKFLGPKPATAQANLPRIEKKRG